MSVMNEVDFENPEAEEREANEGPVAVLAPEMAGSAAEADQSSSPAGALPRANDDDGGTEAEESQVVTAFAEVDSDELYVDFDSEHEPLDTGLEELEAAESEVEVPAGTETGAADESQIQRTNGDSEAHDERQWYVLHCYSGYENKVRHAIEQRIETMGMRNQIFDVVVPTEEEIEVKDGKRRTVESRVFPGYILVQMILSEESWYVARNTPGVTGFVGMGNTPTPLRPEEVNQIIKRMEAEAPKVKVTYKSGQKVRIVDGPFNDFIGTVDGIDVDRAKVRVMVSFFGRETPVELDLLQVEKT